MSELPPERLIRRVGWDDGADHPADVFRERGERQWALVKSLTSEPLRDKRILDFGCGVGRILRPAVDDSPDARFWGCDIDGPSVEWLSAELEGRAEIFRSPEVPRLPFADGLFDVIYAFSVFTHLVDNWSSWLLELHRLIRDDGVLALTVFGPGHSTFAGEPVSEELIGMNVLYPSASWDLGGPLILHSEWWLRAHWGRVFEIVELRLGDPAGSAPLYGQGLVVMRKRPVELATEDLERPEPGEEREIAALRQNVASLRREVARQAAIYQTKSWRLTAPLRGATGRVRRELEKHRRS
jgi:SAM-dependent methyltransferase